MPTNKRLQRLVPRNVRDALLFGLSMLRDWTDSALGRRPALMAPLVLSYRFGIYDLASFRHIGSEFREHFVRLGGLKPGHRVLEIGSGTGRMAAALTSFLRSGRYDGFEIHREAVEWCARNIATIHPNFHFHHADVYNRRYNPAGTFDASGYRLPFADDSFDFAYLTSVFTHMRTSAIENYLREMSRVLRPGGTCLITWFLLDQESSRLLKAGLGSVDFFHPFENGLTTSPRNPEETVAFPEDAVRGLYGRTGLSVSAIYSGSWSGRRPALSFQDIVIARKS